MNSLRGRLLLGAGAVLLVFIALSGLTLQTALERYTEKAEYDRLQGLLFSLLGATEINSDDATAVIALSRVPEPRLGQPDSGLQAIIYNDQGNALWQSPSLLREPASVGLPQVNQWRFSNKPWFSLAYGFEWVLSGDEVGRFGLVVQDLASPLQQQQRDLSKKLWLWMLVMAGLLLLLLVLLMHWGLHPLRQLPRELIEIRSGKRQRLSTEAPDELLPLSSSVNELLEHEQRLRERFRNALADLAHSLKTPLAVLRNHTSADETSGEQISTMESIITYQLHRAATAGSKALREPVEVLPTVQRLVTALGKVYLDKQIEFDIQVPAGFVVPVEENDLMEMLGNVMENAAKYGAAKVRIKAEGNSVTVEDNGPGFPQDAKSMLRRGSRADQRLPGQGIGLAVVSDVMNSYSAKLELGISELGGASVRLDFS